MERAAEIRRFTKPGRPVSLSKVREYASVAARWEGQRRLMARGVSTPSQDEQFLTLTAMLRGLVAELDLPVICTEVNGGPDGVVGCTDRSGFLSKDPARILYDNWSQAYLDPDPTNENLLRKSRGLKGRS
jgi:hypothetical protein